MRRRLDDLVTAGAAGVLLGLVAKWLHRQVKYEIAARTEFGVGGWTCPCGAFEVWGVAAEVDASLVLVCPSCGQRSEVVAMDLVGEGAEEDEG